MYVQECLVRDRHQERLRQAHDERTAGQVAELRKLERRRQRAERALLSTWQRVDRLRATIGAAG